VVEGLLEKYEEPKFRRYKYINSMPASIYKSLQKLVVEVLLRNKYCEELYQQFFFSKTKTPKAKLAEKNLQRLLEKYKLSGKLSIEMIKDWVWLAEGKSAMDASNRFHKKWSKYFKKIEDINELNEALQVFVGAWNYFPHKFLGGRSPEQMIQERLKKPSSVPAREGRNAGGQCWWS